MQNEWQCRWSPTLGDLESTHEEIWGTKKYTDLNIHNPTVFFGCYSFNDFCSIWKHQGRKCILWAGSDLQRFLSGYWLDDKGKIRLRPHDLANWIATYCESYVENEVEQQALASVGITSKVVPSFLGDVNKFEVCFQPGNKLYTSVSGDDFQLYGWDKIAPLAYANRDIEFHCYGNVGVPYPNPFPWPRNVIFHGRVSKEQMNEEIKEMQGALRLTEFDGCSEILVKSWLMGQYPVSVIEYPYTLKLSDIGQITEKTEANLQGREWLLSTVNKYPWSKSQS